MESLLNFNFFAGSRMDTSSFDRSAAEAGGDSHSVEKITTITPSSTKNKVSPKKKLLPAVDGKENASRNAEAKSSPTDPPPESVPANVTSLESSRSDTNRSSGKTYLRAGTGAFNAKSTVGAHAAACRDFNVFLETKNMGSIETLLEDDVTFKLLQEYGGFLIDKAVKASTGVDDAFLKSKTALQYVSGVVITLGRRFPRMKNLREDAKEYELLRSEVERKINDACCKMVCFRFFDSSKIAFYINAGICYILLPGCSECREECHSLS